MNLAPNEKYDKGGRTIAQTASPKSDRIYGSNTNKVGSASSKESAKGIELNESIQSTLTQKASEYNKNNPSNKVNISTLKAVMRRGMGAYSTSHRPTITGGMPNSRQAWGFARVNKFLKKKSGETVKAAYVQDDDLMEYGGEMDKKIALPDSYASYESLKPILENQGYELNKINMKYEDGGEMQNELVIESKYTVSDIDHKYPTISHEYINEQLMDGIRVEMEHTDNPEVARKIALDHLHENIFYYDFLKEMEQNLANIDIDEHYSEINKKYANGGTVDGFDFKTPTGKESKLTYLQQVLVRTKAFKEYFGDWQKAAKMYLMDNKENYYTHYENVSKVIDFETLEPRVVYHGTSAAEKFYSFDVNREKGIGRPYAYFARNREYAMNFVGSKEQILYACFVNIRKPFLANGIDYSTKKRGADYWTTEIKATIQYDKYKNLDKNKQLDDAVESQVGKYIRDTYSVEDFNFWLLMARDIKSDFKYFLIAYGYDGIFADEQIRDPYDINNPREFTDTYIIFDATQVKLADGKNLNFDAMNPDIRYEKGAKLATNNENEELEEPKMMSKGGQMRSLLLGDTEKKYKSGGYLKNEGGIQDDAKKGGLFVGQSHANGGIKAYNVSTNQPIEVEGGEIIITKRAVADGSKKEFEGQMLTNKEILSKINESGGGVAFKDGGEIHGCGCSGKKYKFGGETLEDYMIIRKMNGLYEDSITANRKFIDDLIAKMQ